MSTITTDKDATDKDAIVRALISVLLTLKDRDAFWYEISLDLDDNRTIGSLFGLGSNTVDVFKNTGLVRKYDNDGGYRVQADQWKNVITRLNQTTQVGKGPGTYEYSQVLLEDKKKHHMMRIGCIADDPKYDNARDQFADSKTEPHQLDSATIRSFKSNIYERILQVVSPDNSYDIDEEEEETVVPIDSTPTLDERIKELLTSDVLSKLTKASRNKNITAIDILRALQDATTSIRDVIQSHTHRSTRSAGPQMTTLLDDVNVATLQHCGIPKNNISVLHALVRDLHKANKRLWSNRSDDDPINLFRFKADNGRDVTLLETPSSKNQEAFNTSDRRMKWTNDLLDSIIIVPYGAGTRQRGDAARWTIDRLVRKYDIGMPETKKMPPAALAGMMRQMNIGKSGFRTMRKHTIAWLGYNQYPLEESLDVFSIKAIEPMVEEYQQPQSDGGKTIRYWYKDLDRVILQQMIDLHLEQGKLEYDNMLLVLGGDHGQGAFRIAVKLILV